MIRGQEGHLRGIMSGDYLPVAFVGSGVSTNFPNWSVFIAQLVEYAGSGRRTPLMTAAIQRELPPDMLLHAADDALDELDEPALRDFMRATFVTDEKEAPPVFGSLVRSPFAFFITTNYDCNIEIAYQQNHGQALEVVTPDEVGRSLHLMHAGRPFLLKLHGCALRGRGFVIGHDSYREIIYDNRHLRYVLASILATRPIVFVGYGNRDPHIIRYLEYERSVLPRGAMRRFTFTKDSEELLSLDGYLKRLNVSRIKLSDWGEVEVILDQCAFLRLRDRYQRGRQEHYRDFRTFIERGRVECAWGALMYAYAASDLGHSDDVNRIWETALQNDILRESIEASPALNLVLRIVAGQMLKRQNQPELAAEQFEEAEAVARDGEGILRPLRALGLRYAGVFYLRPPSPEGDRYQDTARALDLFAEARSVLGEEFPEETLDVAKWQAIASSEDDVTAATRRLLEIAAEAGSIGYRKNAAWCRCGAVELSLQSTPPVLEATDMQKQLFLARRTFEELQHPRGLGASDYLSACVLLTTEAPRNAEDVEQHIMSAQAMAILCNDLRLKKRCCELLGGFAEECEPR